MKKILIVNSYYSPDILGGAEVSTQLLAESLAKHHKVCVLTTGSHKLGVKIDRVNGVEVFRLPCFNLYWQGRKKDRNPFLKLGWHLINTFSPLQYKLIDQVIKAINPDIIHTQNLSGIGTYFWKIAKKNRIPIVHTTRDYALFEPVKSHLVNRILSYFNRERSKYVDMVVGISQYILDKHTSERFFLNSKKSVVFNVVNSKRYSRKEYRKGEPLIVGYFGQLDRKKGIDQLVKAIQLIEDKIVDKLVICGTGDLEPELLKQAQVDERIKLRGKIPLAAVNEQMAKVDLTVVPSVWEEPFGRVIIESYNQGTPVMATNVGGIPELMIHKEFLIHNKIQDNIKDLIERFSKIDNQQMKQIIEDNYTESLKYNDNLSLYINIYDEILALKHDSY
ncbi:glycosyltransferase family 4 protein [Rossellomorea vietnamensis]|uniref:Glycosyltransferase family 4 protein n=1 Tax=Rossellomorea vietnamensis TaxID=218284 RepID=A0A5D4NW90_9BACI|nr:glycosyltransferase family 4 protein [Rossellomorea vietnamensis]TYS17744.1 glycosyltransferase family 4 protein [Rossellomorea vietnamensis]